MGQRVCGHYGHMTKAGTPCGYRLAEGDTACPHHSEDKTKQQALVRKAKAAQLMQTLPDELHIEALSTSKDLQFGFQQVIKSASCKKGVDLKRLDVVIRALNGANAVQQTEEIREQNRILMMLDGHGGALAALQRLKEAPVTLLPTRKKPDGSGQKGTA